MKAIRTVQVRVVLQLVSEERSRNVDLLTSDDGDLLAGEDLLERRKGRVASVIIERVGVVEEVETMSASCPFDLGITVSKRPLQLVTSCNHLQALL